MSLLKIIQYGHPLLREKAKDIKQVGSREKELIRLMGETMYDARGIGLAAPQVGVMERLFVLDVDQGRRKDSNGKELERGRLQVFINPEIVWESEEDEPYDEGCLSITGIDGEVFRPSQIKVVARDENFELFEVEADELFARVIQHENDHLNGVLFVDHLKLARRTRIAGALNKLKKATLEELPSLSGEYPILID